MSLNDLLKQPVGSNTPRFAKPESAKKRPMAHAGEGQAKSTADAAPRSAGARNPMARVIAGGAQGGAPKTSLPSLARPGRQRDLYLATDATERRHAPAQAGLNAPKANASRAAVDKQTLPEMAVSKPLISNPRPLDMADVGDAETFKQLQPHFDVVSVKHEDAFTTFATALLHHSASSPKAAGALADGIHKWGEPTGETQPEGHMGFAMLKRWAEALKQGDATAAKNAALDNPRVITMLSHGLRSILRHLQVEKTIKRPISDLQAMHGLAAAADLKLTTHQAGKASSVETDASTMHVLLGKGDALTLLVPKKA